MHARNQENSTSYTSIKDCRAKLRPFLTKHDAIDSQEAELQASCQFVKLSHSIQSYEQSNIKLNFNAPVFEVTVNAPGIQGLKQSSQNTEI
jgi:hypothetical protein